MWGTQKKEKTMDMTEGGIVGKVIAFSLPLLVGNLFQQMYNMVDSVVVGNYEGTDALAAVGTAGMPMSVMLALFTGISAAATILVSQYIGAGDQKTIRDIVRTAHSFLMICSIPILIIGMIAGRGILLGMHVPEEVIDDAHAYLRVIFLGTTASLGYNLNAGVLRGMGNSRAPLISLILSSIVNIVLDLVFVIVLHWGVVGVAAATVIANYVSWFYSIYYIKKKYPQLELKVLSLHMEKKWIAKMLTLGLPLGFNNAVYSLGHLLLRSIVNSHGAVFMAGATASNKLDTLVYLVVEAFAVAATTYAGQNAGAGRMDRLERGVKVLLVINVSINIAVCALLTIFGRQCLAIFNQEPEVIEAGYIFILWNMPFYWLYTAFHTLNCFLNGVGEVKLPTAACLIMFWLFRLPLAYFLSTTLGKEWLYMCYPISWVLGLSITGIYFLRGKWRKKVKQTISEG